MKISTKRGDAGQTSVFGAKQVAKSHSLIELVGEIDELQATIGLLKTKINKKADRQFLTALQKQIYKIMAEVAGSKALPKLTITEWVREIEKTQEKKGRGVNIKNAFVIPGNSESEALAHLVRVKVRSVERVICQNIKEYSWLEKFIPYFNRLSDYFFVFSQVLK